MKRTVLLGFLIAFLAGLASAPVPAAEEDQKIDHRLRFQVGQVFNLEITVESTVVVEKRGHDFRSYQSITFGHKMAVESVDDEGTAMVKATFTKAKFKIDDPDLELDYDSTRPSNPLENQDVTARIFSRMIGQSFKAKVTSAGVVESVRDLEQVRNHVMMNLADVPEELRAEGELLVLLNLNKEVVAADMEFMFGSYPKKPVAIGERWSSKPLPSGDVPCVEQLFCKITDVNDGLVNVKLYRDYKADPDNSLTRLDFADMKFVLNGKAEGTAERDESTGMVKRSRISGKLAGKVTLIAAGGSIEVPVTVEVAETVVAR